MRAWVHLGQVEALGLGFTGQDAERNGAKFEFEFVRHGKGAGGCVRENRGALFQKTNAGAGLVEESDRRRGHAARGWVCDETEGGGLCSRASALHSSGRMSMTAEVPECRPAGAGEAEPNCVSALGVTTHWHTVQRESWQLGAGCVYTGIALIPFTSNVENQATPPIFLKFTVSTL